MPTYTATAVRSPYFIRETGLSGGEVIDVELRLWNEPDTEPTNATYEFSKTIPSTLVTEFDLDIAPYCREFIEHTTRYDSDSAILAGDADARLEAQDGSWCYCTVKVYVDTVLTNQGDGYTKTLACFDGFGYYTEGMNPTQTRYRTPTGITYYGNETGNCGGLAYYDDGTVAGTGIQAKYTGLSTGGTTTVNANYTVGYFPMLHPTYKTEGNTLEYIENGSTIATYRVEAICEPKYTVINCDYVNRHGMWDRIIFFKNSQREFSSKGSEYHFKSGSVNYSTTDARKRHLNINGSEMVTCNTGWVEENFDEKIKDLLLSERILLDNVPVLLKTQNVKLQTSITDKMINYNVKFEYAHNQLQYVV